MASAGSNLRTRVSEEDYRLMCEIVFKHFKKHKVVISDAIKTPFPFLEILRDHEFITSEMYEEYQRSCKNLSTITKVVYAILDNVEETRHLPLLKILFSKVIMKNYPDLNGIREGFRDVILEKIGPQASVEAESAENHNTPLSIEQGTGENTYPSLSWLFSDQDTGAGEQPGVSVNFKAEILPVTCGTMKGQLIKRKLEQGTEAPLWLERRRMDP